MCLSIYIAVTWLRVRGDCSPALEIKYTHLYHCRSGKEIHQKKKKKKKKSSQGEVIQVSNSECLKMVGRPLQCQHVKVLDKETHVWKQASLFERAIMV